jgi:HEAT repeat protein
MHWRHAGLEAVLSQDNARAQLRRAMRSTDASVAATAAIGLARLDDSSSLEQLESAAHDASLKLPDRGAAIEAIGQLDSAQADDVLAELVQEVGRYQGQARARYVPELHADLMRAMARRDRDQHTQAIERGLESPSAAVRLEATRAYAVGHRAPPRQLVERASDDAAKVRAAAIEALVASRHPDAQEAAVRGLNDYDLHVRLAAIQALGVLPAAENAARLNELAANTSDLIRAAGLKALAKRGDLPAVVRAADDSSWRVRSVVAKALGKLPYAERAPLARALVADPSLQVQRQTLQALADWPLAEAIPALLAAIEGRTAATRREAVEQLQARWPAAAELSPVASPATLAAEAARLRDVWQREFAAEIGSRLASSSTPTSNPTEDIQAAAAAVEGLAAGALADRRAAARQLALEHAQAQLPNAALSRLRELVEEETDALVWNDLLAFLEIDGREAAADLAAIAATHPTGEVRRRACAYFAHHPSPRAAEVLMNSLADDDVTVVREAVRGLGLQPRVADLSPLRAVLTSTDSSLRLEAATSLARLGSDEGVRALLRLTHHQDPAVRRQAEASLQAIGAAPPVGP